MKFLSLDNVIRLAIVNFLVFTALVIYQQQVVLPVKKIPERQEEKIFLSPTQTPSLSPTSSEPVVETLAQQAARHGTPSDCWMLIKGHIYDITGYFGQHPGGDTVMANYCGKEATVGFDSKGKAPAIPHSDYAISLLSQYLVK